MKKVLMIICLFICTLIIFAGCEKTNNNDIVADQKNEINNQDSQNTDNLLNDEDEGELEAPELTRDWSDLKGKPLLMDEYVGTRRGYYYLGYDIKSYNILDTSKDPTPQEYDATWDISYFNDGTVTLWAKENDDGTDLYYGANGKIIVTNAVEMFHNKSCQSITGLENLDFSYITDMSRMFSYCTKLTQLDVSSLDTSKVTNMSGMFKDCYNLKKLDLSNFDTSNVRDMKSMFSQCYELESVDLSSFNTGKVRDMSYMFFDMGPNEKIINLDLSTFNTSRVTNMQAMFFNVNVEELDLSNFDTRNVTNMDTMFFGCSYLKKLDVSSFDTRKVEKYGSIFSGCSKLENADSLLKFDN